MAKRDLDKAASRYLNALRRITSGIETQRQRILDRAANAPRLLEGSPYEVTDLSGDPGNDLDYYIYELGRLRHIGVAATKVFGQPQELLDARAAFEAGIPNLKSIRDPLTHPNDTDDLDDVAWFSSVVRVSPDGRSEDLVDPRYGHHDAAMAYSAALTRYLSGRIQVAIAANPPASLKEQIVERQLRYPPHRPQ